MIVLVDAEDRENEGDLVVPAQMATPDVVNFMAKHGRGLICLTLTQARAHELRLEFDGAHQRLAQPHRLHGIDRSEGRHLDRHLGARSRPHHRHRHRSRPRAPPTSCLRAMYFRWWLAKAAS